ncbi:hypothetical protein [uncultured Rhodoblastus sp.]|uniref:hypothetical protein n=1 Tax=uncultured Rhodoblastus sp. TaxID=543037 RepID=UPI0025F260FA|nr:hypothetical protein [uncultured Rhodoblastus sp.]
MVIAVVEQQGNFFRWNLSANVGPRQPNKPDDVELVRFGYFCMKQNVRIPPKPELRPFLEKVRPIGPFDQDLADMIAAHERTRGGSQDGIISVAKISFSSNNGEHYDGVHPWIIVVLNNNMLTVVGDIYPRIDMHKQAGPEISKTVKNILTNDSWFK